MPALLNANTSTAATTYTSATEVVAISSIDPINTLDATGQGVLIMGVVAFTAGGTGGTVVLKCRQGTNTTTGTLVGTQDGSNTVASVPYCVPFMFYDPSPAAIGPGNAGLPLYTVTATVGGSNGTGQYAAIAVIQVAGNN